LTRSTSVRSPNPPSCAAATATARARAFSSVATASSRSRITASHGSVRALTMARGLLAGMNSALRRRAMVMGR
jgi:hypothetical protein